MTDTPPSLWKFAVAVYEQPEIAALCLRLQDDHGFDVNLLLTCLWHGQYLGAMDAAVLDAALDFSRQWQNQVVAPLRGTRRWLKQQPGNAATDTAVSTLREQVKACELAAEQLQLARLEAMIVATTSRSASGERVSDTRAAVINNLACLQRRMSSDQQPSRPEPVAATATLNALAANYCRRD